MLIDLNLQDKQVIIIGGGKEALKRTNALINQECNILVISNKLSAQINKLAKSKKIKIKKQNLKDATFLSKYRPYMIITTTNDYDLNQKIIKNAKRKGIITYSSDNPEESDFANPAIIDFENTIQIGIFTGGKSPAMSKKLRIQSEQIFRKIITKEDIAHIKIQNIVRKIAKETISNHTERKKYLHYIMSNEDIDQLIKDGHLKKAEKLAITILRNWK